MGSDDPWSSLASRSEGIRGFLASTASSHSVGASRATELPNSWPSSCADCTASASEGTGCGGSACCGGEDDWDGWCDCCGGPPVNDGAWSAARPVPGTGLGGPGCAPSTGPGAGGDAGPLTGTGPSSAGHWPVDPSVGPDGGPALGSGGWPPGWP